MTTSDTVQATIHAQIQLTSATSKYELSVPLVAHFALKIFPEPADHFFEFPPTLMLAFICVAKLFLNPSDALLTVYRANIWWRCPIDDLLRSTH